jgi:hypothetical protein
LIVDPDFGDVATTLEAKSIGVGSGIRVEECSATNGPTATEQRGNALLDERIFVKGSYRSTSCGIDRDLARRLRRLDPAEARR